MCITGCSFDCNLEELTRNETVWCMHTSNVKVVYSGAVDPWLFFYFAYTHSGAVTKIDAINSNVQRIEHNLVTSG